MPTEREDYYNDDDDFCYNGQIHEATPWNDRYYVYTPTTKVYDDPDDPRSDVEVRDRISKAEYHAALAAVKADLGISE